MPRPDNGYLQGHRTGGRIVEFHVHGIDAQIAVQTDFHTFDFSVLHRQRSYEDRAERPPGLFVF